MTTQKILLPYQFTRLDKKALDFVIQTFGKLEDVAVTVFNAYTPVPEIEVHATSVTNKLQGNLRYLIQKIKENEDLLREVKEKLISAGFPVKKVEYVFRPRKKDVASEIIDLATSKHIDIIVLNRKHARVTRFFSGSTSNKVIMNLKDVTVCIVT
jgi:nucleotide-binding universal stress UspA family protein